MARIAVYGLILMLTICLLACGGRSAKQQTSLDAAVSALGKIEAATQVGVNYQAYGQLLIDAKSQVNESSAILTEEKVKQDINWVMDAYADAGTVWGKKIQSISSSLYTSSSADKILIDKYFIPTTVISPDGLWASADLDSSMQLIWAHAAIRLGGLKMPEGQKTNQVP